MNPTIELGNYVLLQHVGQLIHHVTADFVVQCTVLCPSDTHLLGILLLN